MVGAVSQFTIQRNCQHASMDRFAVNEPLIKSARLTVFLHHIHRAGNSWNSAEPILRHGKNLGAGNSSSLALN
jgi:hypothetical protein